MKNFLAAIDKTGKLLSRLKTVGFIVLIVFAAFSIFKHGYNKTEIEELIHRTTGLDFENDVLHNHIEERDSAIIVKELTIESLQDAIQRSEGRVNRLIDKYADLYIEFNELADSILTVPSDSSYKFLNETAFPYPGIRKFPFNEPQVKTIHLTVLEHKSLSKMNVSLEDRIVELNDQILIKDSVQLESGEMVLMMKASAVDHESIIDNKDEIIDEQADYIKKKKKGNRVVQYIGAGIIVILAILAAGGG